MPLSLSDILQNGDYYLDINGKSKHLGTDEKFNEDNKGFGVTTEYGNKLATMGHYRNSMYDDSYYAGMGFKKRFGDKYYTDLGLLYGAVTGYEDKVTPMVLPMVSFGVKGVGKLNMMYAPEYKNNPSVLMMNLGIPIR